MKRLFYDIETAPNIGLFWEAGYDQDISYKSIVQERAIITIAWKWGGKGKVHHLAWKEKYNDKSILQQFMPIANDADELVAHFGDKFDMPWVRTRALYHRIGALPLYKTVDTCSWARKHFKFNSNKLDYLASFLGIGHKIKTDYDLWKDIVIHDSKPALKRMIRYNKMDVVLLEKVWERLQAVVPHHSHAGVLMGGEKWTCPRDGSENVHISKTRVTASGAKQYQMHCNECGSYYKMGETARKEYMKR